MMHPDTFRPPHAYAVAVLAAVMAHSVMDNEHNGGTK